MRTRCGFGFVLVCVALLAPVRAWADDDYTAYEKLNTSSGWVEYLEKNTTGAKVEKARVQLANALAKEKRVTISVGHGPAVKCGGGSITQSEMVAALHVVGSKWDWACESPASLSYSMNNPTKTTLYVRARAHDEVFDLFVHAGATAKGTVKVKTPCDKEARQGYKKAFSRGRVTFTCNDRVAVVAATPAEAEAKAYPNLLTKPREGEFEKFIAEFPESALVAFVRERIEQALQGSRDALLKKVKSKVTLGTKPAKLVDGQPYTLALTNPTSDDISVTVEHENGKQDVSVTANATASVDLMTKPSKTPEYRLVAARKAPE